MKSLGIDVGGTSVKIAALVDGQVVWTGRSAMYRRPGAEELVAAMREATGGKGVGCDAVGLCVPGLLDRANRVVTLSVNVPGLVGRKLDDLVRKALGNDAPSPTLVNDANAAGYDLYTAKQLSGRLFVLALGTGIGAAVIDDTGPLYVDGESPGHFGQIDVSIHGEPVLGPDGGAGGLEGYLGVAALRGRYGDGFSERLSMLDITEPPMRALVRAVRIGHAIYRPQHVCLAGGIGNALRPLLPALRKAMDRDLTSIARPGWTLGCGESDYHAALGAAKLARGDFSTAGERRGDGARPTAP